MRTPRPAENARIHHPRPGPPSRDFADLLGRRRAELAAALATRRSADRYFPVLSVLAPVMTQEDGDITYPGDPMCLYAALSVAVHNAVEDSGPLQLARHYNDLAPRWTEFPGRSYRMSAGSGGYRPPASAPNTDETIFDPRVWDTAGRQRWNHLLDKVQPRLVLISSVSPAHRYALEIARMAKERLPAVYVVLGGRHADETVRLRPGKQSLETLPCSTLDVLREPSAGHIVDVVISGEAYYSLDLLMRAIALAGDLHTGWIDKSGVGPLLSELMKAGGPAAGRSVIALRGPEGLDVYPQEGPPTDLAALPDPYEAFAIRSRFPIFASDAGAPRRTAHMMTADACPYRCSFCSESGSLVGRLQRFGSTSRGVARVRQYVRYGAEAIYFDDSVFWSGRSGDIRSFCDEMITAREAARMSPKSSEAVEDDEADRRRFAQLEWGAQFTVEMLTARRDAHRCAAMLDSMRAAGCTYVYLGIESMSDRVMSMIHKNLRSHDGRTWAAKVRAATALVKAAGMRVGTSVLFGLDGETRDTIDETIAGVERLIGEGLIDLASPNILTYHPATPVTESHGMTDRLDYHSPNVARRAPYTYFEEAYPGVISVLLTEEDLWHIHGETRRRWRTTARDSVPLPT